MSMERQKKIITDMIEEVSEIGKKVGHDTTKESLHMQKMISECNDPRKIALVFIETMHSLEHMIIMDEMKSLIQEE